MLSYFMKNFESNLQFLFNLIYVRIQLVMNRDTRFSKRTAFVHFKSKEDAEKCVKKIENESTICFHE